MPPPPKVKVPPLKTTVPGAGWMPRVRPMATPFRRVSGPVNTAPLATPQQGGPRRVKGQTEHAADYKRRVENVRKNVAYNRATAGKEPIFPKPGSMRHSIGVIKDWDKVRQANARPVGPGATKARIKQSVTRTARRQTGPSVGRTYGDARVANRGMRSGGIQLGVEIALASVRPIRGILAGKKNNYGDTLRKKGVLGLAARAGRDYLGSMQGAPGTFMGIRVPTLDKSVIKRQAAIQAKRKAFADRQQAHRNRVSTARIQRHKPSPSSGVIPRPR